MNQAINLASGCTTLDALLEGGLEPDACALVFGEAGSGKTNYALQCAKQATDAGKRVAYVDTEGVSPVRLAQVFEGGVTDKVLFFTPYSISEQERMVEKSTLLQDLGLIVVDSINMHYRLHIDGDDEKQKDAGRSLYAQLHHLTVFARRHKVPVLITGQVYGTEDQTQPFARRVMEHLVKIMVRFEKRNDGSRRATLLKHRSIPEGMQTSFKIGPNGLEPTRRKRPAPAAQAEAPPEPAAIEDNQPAPAAPVERTPPRPDRDPHPPRQVRPAPTPDAATRSTGPPAPAPAPANEQSAPTSRPVPPAPAEDSDQDMDAPLDADPDNHPLEFHAASELTPSSPVPTTLSKDDEKPPSTKD